MSFIRRFDLYREVQSDFTKSTTTGAVVSLVSLLVMSALFLSEFLSYRAVRQESTMLVDAPVDTQDEHAMLQINMNITVHKLPCAILSVDAQDVVCPREAAAGRGLPTRACRSRPTVHRPPPTDHRHNS